MSIASKNINPIPTTLAASLIRVGQRYHECCSSILTLRHDIESDDLHQELRKLSTENHDSCLVWSLKCLKLAMRGEPMPWEEESEINE